MSKVKKGSEEKSFSGIVGGQLIKGALGSFDEKTLQNILNEFGGHPDIEGKAGKVPPPVDNTPDEPLPIAPSKK